MITDLKADSARWEADVSRRADLGYPQGSYTHEIYTTQAPNLHPASYAPSPVQEARHHQGPSPPPYTTAPPPQFMDPYAPNPYGAVVAAAPPPAPNAPYPNAPAYGSGHSPYGSGQPPYQPPPPPANPYTGVSQPPVTAPDPHQSYTYGNMPYGFDPGRNNAPRYPGPGYDNDPEYSPATSGMPYPATTVPDPRTGMDPLRYTPESAYPERARPQPIRDAHRRNR